jgi:hypothetical protein
VTTLIDELRSDQGKPNTCALCAWLQTLTDADRKEWSEALGDRSFTHTSILRAARKRGYAHGVTSIEGHRKGLHP